MAIFHKTLQDAENAFKAGNIESALKILVDHRDTELTEENYIESSLYALKLYLHNYTNRLNMAIEILTKKELSEQDRNLAKEHIERCIVNIKEFEEGVKTLLKREGALLE